MPNVRSEQTDKVDFFGKTTPLELVKTYGTPLYVYNENVLLRRCRDLLGLSSLPGFHVNYSAKANTNPALLRIIREEGCHADAMSPGELHVNKLAGFTPDRLLYVCNNVSADEMKNAVDNGLLVSVDSLSQLDLYGTVNPGGKVMIRVNPGIGAGHHKKVVTAGKETKFGIDPTAMDEVRALLRKHDLTLAGINQHIGSLFMEPDNYLNAIDFLLHFVRTDLADLFPSLELIDFGGGLGIPYRKYENQPRLDMESLGIQLHAKLSAWVEETGYKGKFFIEPGRYVVAECGVLLGTGGLLRAYTAAAADALADAGISEVRRWLACEVSTPYALYEPVRAAVAALGGVVQETQYAAAVTVCALLPEEAGEAFAAQVRDLTAGRCAVRPVGETERAVPLAGAGL